MPDPARLLVVLRPRRDRPTPPSQPPTWLLRLLVRGQHRDRPPHGFTIIEILVAMLIASIMMMILTPPMFMSTAARVQQRRAQQALQLGQAEVDRVRTTVERGSYTTADLPTSVTTNLTAVPAPSTIAASLKSANPTCNTYMGTSLATNALLPVDTNGDCVSDFLVQTFRTTGPAGTSVPVTGFRMGVRVYADIPQLRNGIGQLSPVPARLSFSSGLGVTIRQPLAVLQVTIVRSDTGTALQDYRAVCTSGNC